MSTDAQVIRLSFPERAMALRYFLMRATNQVRIVAFSMGLGALGATEAGITAAEPLGSEKVILAIIGLASITLTGIFTIARTFLRQRQQLEQGPLRPRREAAREHLELVESGQRIVESLGRIETEMQRAGERQERSFGGLQRQVETALEAVRDTIREQGESTRDALRRHDRMLEPVGDVIRRVRGDEPQPPSRG